MRPSYLCLILVLSGSSLATAADQVLTARMHHLRNEPTREWSSFPDVAEAASLELTFRLEGKPSERTLQLRQQDVKQPWNILINDMRLGKLQQNENDMVRLLAVPKEVLRTGENRLTISTESNRGADDIRIGEIRLLDRAREEILAEGKVSVEVLDRDGRNIPARLTILNQAGALTAIGAESSDTLAVRTGVVYTGNGLARFGLPAGSYTVIAGRGFEWGIDTERLVVQKGGHHELKLRLKQEVATPGLVSCDTHVHTLTYSRHGDSTLDERIITVAAEGVELPIATDHNLHIDYRPAQQRLKMDRYFTPVIGNEVTTRVGHFNVFPVVPDAPLPDHRLETWPEIIASIRQTPNVQAIILNHGRDLHSNWRPLGPAHHIAVSGDDLHDWGFGANAMELVNSGATQTDIMQLVHDWFGLLNRGYQVTPVGCSDSHDVARHFIGQGRTYIRCPDENPGRIPVDHAVRSFVAGRVSVSYGLLATLSVDGQLKMGEVVSADEPVQVDVTVSGPRWSTANVVELYANGRKVRQSQISTGRRAGIKWKGSWRLPRFEHDVHLVAVARGPGIESLHWPTAKSYQPTSPIWEASVFSCTGPTWLDADGDGKPTSAFQYAQQIVKNADGRIPQLLDRAAGYDSAVAVQLAAVLQKRDPGILLESEFQDALSGAADHVREGIGNYLHQWRQSQILSAER